MQTRAVALLLVGVWAAVAVASGAKGKLQLSPLKLSTEQLHALQGTNLRPEHLQILHGVLVRAIEDAADGWKERFRTTMDAIARRDVTADDIESFVKASGPTLETEGFLEETLRKVMLEGIEGKVPVLDPLFIDHVPVVFTIPDVLEVDGQLDNVTLSGLANFTGTVPLEEKSITIIKFSVYVLFDLLEQVLELASKYKLDAHLEALDIWGEGNISIKLFALHLDGEIKVSSGVLSKTKVDPCSIDLSAVRSEVVITGLFGGGIPTQLVGEVFTDLLNENLNTLTSFVAQTAEESVCGYLKSMSFLDYVKLALGLIRP